MTSLQKLCDRGIDSRGHCLKRAFTIEPFELKHIYRRLREIARPLIGLQKVNRIATVAANQSSVVGSLAGAPKAFESHFFF